MLAVAVANVLAAWTCTQEDERVRAHLEDALAQLATPARALSVQQAERRAIAVDALRRYVAAGRFPRNHSTEPATPVFVDASGTHCAMGALISQLGGADIVEHIRATRNLATVPALWDEPGLLEWLEAWGLEPEEAALVQPSYFSCEPVFRPSSTTSASEGILLHTDAGIRMLVSDTVAGVPACVGSIYPFNLSSTGGIDWPHETVVTFPQLFANDGLGWTAPQFRNCAWRPRITDADRAALLDTFLTEAQVRFFHRDLRWMITQCHRNFGAPNLDFCGADGRFRAAVLPTRGTMQAAVRYHFSRVGIVDDAGFADAGIELTLIDALEAQVWAFSDDGGEPLDSGVAAAIRWMGPYPTMRMCGDAGAEDAGAGDAGGSDAGVVDAGSPDAGSPDAGSPDAGVRDAGTSTPPAEAGSADGGSSVGAPEPAMGCGCDATPGAALLLLAAAATLGRRRRGPLSLRA